MECDKCLNEVRILALEEKDKRNSETHEKFYNNFENLRTMNAVREERDKNIDKSLSMIMQSIGELRGIVTEMQNRPMKQVDSIMDKVIDKVITFLFMAIVGYVLYVMK